jgi:hypothetical protein
MLKVMHAEGHFFDSLEEAWAFLRTIIQKEASETRRSQ